MKNPPHPGLSVRHDCLEPLRLNVKVAAKRLGVSRKQLPEIVNCHAGISREKAIRFDKAFGGGADTWSRFQVSGCLRLGESDEACRRNQGRTAVISGLM